MIWYYIAGSPNQAALTALQTGTMDGSSSVVFFDAEDELSATTSLLALAADGWIGTVGVVGWGKSGAVSTYLTKAKFFGGAKHGNKDANSLFSGVSKGVAASTG